MKIVIDISKDKYDEIMSMDWKNCRRFFDEEIRAIHDGKALEQQFCGDCISREETLKALMDEWTDFDSELMDYLIEKVKKLPSVTPQPKMGRWIEHFDQIFKWYECDQCHTDWGDSVNYCPNCGSKMYEIPTGQIVANGELYPEEFDDPLAEEGSDKE